MLQFRLALRKGKSYKNAIALHVVSQADLKCVAFSKKVFKGK